MKTAFTFWKSSYQSYRQYWPIWLTHWQKYFGHYALAAIMLLATYLRFTHLNWDQGLMFHPDERNIANAVSKLQWPDRMDPEFYAYNGLSIYLIEFSSEAVSWWTADESWLGNWGKINLIGRFYSATFATLSVGVFFLIMRRLVRVKFALLAALLLATTVGMIQYAHYGVTESLLVLEVLILVYLAQHLLKQRQTNYLYLMALVWGLSLATKTSALSFGLIPLSAMLLSWPHYRRKWLFFANGLLFVLVVASVFYACSPHTLSHLDKFLESMRYEGGVVRGTLPVPYTMQFLDTPKYWYQLYNLSWQTSPLVMTLALAGLLSLIWNYKLLLKYRHIWPWLIFSVVYFAYVGSWYTKFIRYMLPIIPILIALLCIFLQQLKSSRIKTFVVAVLIGSNIFWALAYVSIFERPASRIQASEWVLANIQSGSLILNEHWDDGIPVLSRPGVTYQRQDLRLYEPDTPAKLREISQQLAAADYVIIGSRRLIGSITRNPELPFSGNYYRLLFTHQLGYKLVAEFSSYPQLWGLTIPDNLVEETFQVYDHPVIYVFANQDRLEAPEILSKINKLSTK